MGSGPGAWWGTGSCLWCWEGSVPLAATLTCLQPAPPPDMVSSVRVGLPGVGPLILEAVLAEAWHSGSKSQRAAGVHTRSRPAEGLDPRSGGTPQALRLSGSPRRGVPPVYTLAGVQAAAPPSGLSPRASLGLDVSHYQGLPPGLTRSHGPAPAPWARLPCRF